MNWTKFKDKLPEIDDVFIFFESDNSLNDYIYIHRLGEQEDIPGTLADYWKEYAKCYPDDLWYPIIYPNPPKE